MAAYTLLSIQLYFIQIKKVNNNFYEIGIKHTIYNISVGSSTVKPLQLMRSVDVSNAVDSFGQGSGNYAEFPDKHSDIFNPPTGVIYRDQSALDQWIKNKTAPETVSWKIKNIK